MTQIGPFTVEDGDAQLTAAMQAVAAALPPAMSALDAAGAQRVWHSKRFGAPSYAWGFTPGAHDEWVNPAKVSHSIALASQMEYVGGHEYWHGWRMRHRAAANAVIAAVRPYMVGTSGNVESAHSTNRLDEGLADAFARAIGFHDGPALSWARYSVPASAYGVFIAALGKVGASAGPTHTLRLSQRVALRAAPQVEAPVVAWAVSGQQIRAVAGRSGGPYTIPDRAGGAGFQSSLWLEVTALDQRPLAPSLWSAELLWVPLAAQPMPPTPPAQP